MESVFEGIDAFGWGDCGLRGLRFCVLFRREPWRQRGGGKAEALFVDLDGLEAEIERVLFGGVPFEDFDTEDAALPAVAPESPVDVGSTVCGSHFGGRWEFRRAVPCDVDGFGVVVCDAA